MKQTSAEMPEMIIVSAGINKWYLTVNVDINKIGDSYEYLSESTTLDHFPTLSDIKTIIFNIINSDTDEKILSGFVWNDINVWLSSENQFNFKAAYDLALQTNGANLPIKFKLGQSNDTPIYYTFDTLDSFSNFYMSAIVYINDCLNAGWYKKDNFDWAIYEEALNNKTQSEQN